MREKSPSRASAYLVAIALAAAAVGVRWLLAPWLGGELPLVTTYAAVAVAVWYGGTGPALLCTALAYLACDFLFIEPVGRIGLDSVPHILGLFAYLSSCAIIVGFGEALRTARARANERQELLSITLASIGDGVITTDLGGRVTALNSVAESLTGWSRSDAVGKPLDAVFHIVSEESGAPVESPVTRALRDGSVVGLANHTVLIARDGTRRPIDDSAAPIRDREGRVAGCVMVFRDVTERRLAEQALRRSEQDLRDFFENASIGMHWVGPDGTLLRVNQSELDMLGYAREEFVGRNIAEFHADGDVIENILRCLSQGETLHEYEARLRCKDGSIKHVVINSSVLREGGRFVHTRCFTRDVTQQKQAEQAQRASEAMARQHLHDLQTIYETTPVGMCLLDRELRYVRINDRLAEMNGLPAAEHIGRTMREIVPGIADEVEPAFRRILETGAAVIDAEVTGETKARPGVRRSWLESWFPHVDETGRVVGVNVVAQEITARKQAEALLRESEALFRTMGEAVPNFLGMSDAQGRPIYQNPAWARYVGLSYEELAAGGWERAHHPDDLPALRQLWAQAGERGDAFQVELRIRRHDGEYRWFAGRTVPLKDEAGRVIKWVGTMTDIHDLKQAEEALRTANRRKDEFLATLSHELRNPLAPVRNSLEIMKRARDDAEAVERARSTMERQVSQMERLIDDLLDISRITRNRLELRWQRVELASVAHHAVEACRPLAEVAGLQVTVTLPPEPVYVHADPVRLAQVLGNLLNNACKFTERGGRVWLTAERQRDDVIVRVKDTGIGIPADKLPGIFDMFTQVDQSLERSRGGLGIGLSLVKQLVEMHAGQVEARSEGPGRGSEFVVRLPVLVEPVEVRPPPPVVADAPSSRGLRILVVDDNGDSAESLAMLLRLTGHETALAGDGLAAVEAAERFRPDAVLLDIGLPRLNGYDACRRIRAQDWGHEMVVVALTGWGQDEDRRKSKDAGFDGHLVKPVDHDLLMKLLASLLEERRGRGRPAPVGRA